MVIESYKDFLKDLLVILVVYKMKANETPAYQSLTLALQDGQLTTSLFIYDNSPVAHEPKMESCWDAVYTHHEANAGVSKAYNEGFKRSQKLHKQWLMLTDQDTIYPKTIFRDYFNARSNNPGVEIFAPIMRSRSEIISPFRFAYGRGIRASSIDGNLKLINDFKFINSGLLICANLFDRAGGYDERFPLDFSDLAFAQRIKKLNKTFGQVNTTCSHALSSTDESFSMMLVRFYFFLKGSKLYGDLYGPRLFLFINRFLRAVKLGLSYQSTAFLKMFISIDFEQR